MKGDFSSDQSERETNDFNPENPLSRFYFHKENVSSPTTLPQRAV